MPNFPDLLGPDLEARTKEILARDYLYEDPASFRAGVLAAVRLMSEAGTARGDQLTHTGS